MPFGCSKCGLCCQFVGLLVEKAKQNEQNDPIMVEIRQFPYSYDKSGRCEKLSFDNQCTVYNSRPLMCQVEGMHKKYFQEYSQEEFFKMNETQCQVLKKIDKMIKFKKTEDNLVIEIPLDLLVNAAENNSETPLVVNDKHDFAEKVMFELEYNLGSIESGLTGFQQLLDKAFYEVCISGHDCVELKEDGFR